jgi:hypothetical protein
MASDQLSPESIESVWSVSDPDRCTRANEPPRQSPCVELLSETPTITDPPVALHELTLAGRQILANTRPESFGPIAITLFATKGCVRDLISPAAVTGLP